jgi:hypothetical protein
MITAPKDKPTFAKMLNPKSDNCLLSSKLLDSSAKDDIVVNDPQNPTATSNEYFVSRFQATDKIENMPKTKLPRRLTTSMFSGKVSNNNGEETILYRRKAPASAPIANNKNSIPLIFLFTYHFLILIGRHYQHLRKRFWINVQSKANAIACMTFNLGTGILKFISGVRRILTRALVTYNFVGNRV